MTDPSYVASGYAVTAVALAGYWLRLRVATRRARQSVEATRRPAAVARRSATAPVREP
jgi:uncharacterized membrane protein YciS (DUF1049 family)